MWHIRRNTVLSAAAICTICPRSNSSIQPFPFLTCLFRPFFGPLPHFPRSSGVQVSDGSPAVYTNLKNQSVQYWLLSLHFAFLMFTLLLSGKSGIQLYIFLEHLRKKSWRRKLQNYRRLKIVHYLNYLKRANFHKFNQDRINKTRTEIRLTTYHGKTCK